MPHQTKRILLLIETSKAYGRALLEGIGRYAETHGRWSMYVSKPVANTRFAATSPVLATRSWAIACTATVSGTGSTCSYRHTCLRFIAR